jgi:hypothetical protein
MRSNKKLRAEADKRVKRAEYRLKKKSIEATEKAAIVAKLEGKLEAKLEVENLIKVNQQKTIRNLHAKGLSIEDIADAVMKPIAFVLEALES